MNSVMARETGSRYGVLLPGLEVPASRDDRFQDRTFGIMPVRWNLNAVRLPVSVVLSQRDGRQYLDRVTVIVNRANAAGLVAILAPCEDTLRRRTSDGSARRGHACLLACVRGSFP
jgi:hypothetical protein